ncbi:hypothetical protein ZWY2020_046439 [Hordeum vulgare]|nr:hypothetical protein ZWY2020_046439 [Hordeum vulgare]
MRAHILNRLDAPRRDDHPGTPLGQHSRRLRPMPDVAPVMMAVREPRSGQAAVTSSAVDLEPNPLVPGEPSRLAACSIFGLHSPPRARRTSIFLIDALRGRGARSQGDVEELRKLWRRPPFI